MKNMTKTVRGSSTKVITFQDTKFREDCKHLKSIGLNDLYLRKIGEPLPCFDLLCETCY